jgi:hypothetical protein
MTSGPERPDAAKGDQRSPDAMDLRLGIRVARFPGEQDAMVCESPSRFKRGKIKNLGGSKSAEN